MSLVWGTRPFARERRGLVTPLYPRCSDVQNVDMTNQIAVQSNAYVIPRARDIIRSISLRSRLAFGIERDTELQCQSSASDAVRAVG